MAPLGNRLRNYLGSLQRNERLRVLRDCRPLDGGVIERGGRRLVDASSNDYLGLARHSEVIARARAWTEDWGAGARASRLVTGSFELHSRIEEKLARLKGTEAALIFSSGYQTNSAVLPALFDRDLLGEPAVVFADRLIHASLHRGCAAAGVRQIRFRHNDLDHLEHLMKAREAKPGALFIITESVFSMDGDRSNLGGLCDLAERYGAVLYVDEAHATGVLGPKGMGLSGEHPGRVDVVMGTFSKALGGFGAYVACSQVLKDYLVNRCGGFIYSTALPPAVLGAMDAALDLVPGMEAERQRLHANAGRLRTALTEAGLSSGASSTQIVPAFIGGASDALEAACRLEEDGVLGIAIRPPTVPRGTSRIRFALSAEHGDEAMERILSAVAGLTRFA